MSHFPKLRRSIFGIMKNNAFVRPALEPWLLHEDYARNLETLHKIQSGKISAPQIDRNEIFAAALLSEAKQETPSVSQKRIAVISMRGLLTAYGDWWWLGADDYLDLFRKLNDNDQIGAVVVKMDGPGSSIDAINIMKEFANEKRKPFVVLANKCYSGYYWSAIHIADHIMAYGNISSGFGSIGVLNVIADYRKYDEINGFKTLIIRAPQSTTKAQAMVDYYEGRDDAFIEAMKEEMRPMAAAFINDVKSQRKKLKTDTEGLFTGSTFTASESLKIGLIDSIGDEKLAVQKAQILMELKNY